MSTERWWNDIGTRKLIHLEKNQSLCHFFHVLPWDCTHTGYSWTNEQNALMECYYQEKTKILGKKPVSVTLSPRQIPHVLARDQTRRFKLWTGDHLNHVMAESRTAEKLPSSWQLWTWHSYWTSKLNHHHPSSP